MNDTALNDRLLLWSFVLLILALCFTSCVAPKAEPVVPTKTTLHEPTKKAPWRWTDDRLMLDVPAEQRILNYNGTTIFPATETQGPRVVIGER